MSRISLEFPLIRRELVGLLRTRRAFWLLFLCVALSGGFTLLSWPSEGEGEFGMWVYRPFQVLILAELTVLLLIIPAFTAGAIAGEREHGTYETLLTTLVRPSSVIFSKLVSSIGYLIFILFASAPCICLLVLGNILSLGLVLLVHVVMAAAVVMSGTVCLLHSQRSRTTGQAAVKGFIWTVVLNGGASAMALPLMRVVGLQAFDQDRFDGFFEYLMENLFPHHAIDQLSSRWLSGANRLQLSFPPWAVYLAYSSLITLLHLVLLLRGARHVDPVGLEARGRFSGLLVRLRKALKSRPAFLTRWIFKKAGKGWPLVSNPVFLKEIRAEFIGQTSYRRGIFVLLTVIFCPLMYTLYKPGSSFLWTEGLIAAAAGSASILIALVVPAVTAASLCREVEQGNLDFYRGTLLPLRTLLHGKLLAGIYSGLGIAGAACVGILFTLATYPAGILIALSLTGVAAVVLILAFSAALGAFAAVIWRKTLHALVFSYASLLVLFFLPQSLLAIVTDRGLRSWIALYPFSMSFVTAGSVPLPFVFDMKREGSALLALAVATLLLWALSAYLIERRWSRDR